MIWSAVAWVLAGAILACLMLAIATDLARRIIPNGLVLVVLGCGIGLRLFAGPWPLLASVRTNSYWSLTISMSMSVSTGLNSC